MSISATAPCIALSRHNMPLVYAAETNGVHTSSNPAEVLYHNMKYVSVRTRRHVMRHKPYLLLQSDDDALPPVCEIFGNRPAEPRCATDDLSTTVLYYSDPLCSVKDVVEADGRFHDRCTITQLTGPDDNGIGDRAIRDFDHDVLCIEGKWYALMLRLIPEMLHACDYGVCCFFLFFRRHKHHSLKRYGS